VGTLDKLVARARGDSDGGEHLQGGALDLPEPEPWSEPVDGDAVLDELATLLTNHVVMAREGAHATALWILHAHLLDQAQMNPRLLIKSPEKQCGKTTLLSLISQLVPRPLPASNITPAAVFRAIDQAHPTLLIDEADALFAVHAGSRTPEAEALRGIVNSGHARAMAFVVRIEGESHEPRQFSTWAAMALAAIGRLPGTIEDRGIPISLKRRLPGEKIARFRHDRVDAAIHDAARRAARWARDNAAAVGRLDPEVPPELQDRVADNWRPLLAVAEVAQGEWPQHARAAAIALAREGARDRESTGVQLLSDIRAIFRKRATDRLSSEALVADLVALENRSWAEWGRSRKPLTKNGLAALLREFKIEPKVIRLDDGRTPRGYTLAAFKDAFARYLGEDREAATGTGDPT
jgi:putative DNA primase/helicase